jgi:putative ABC transport system ATP-binding protein
MVVKVSRVNRPMDPVAARPSPKASPVEPLVELRNVVLRYGDRMVLDALSLRLEEGTSAAIMGPSGSGKTSLLHCIAGILRPDSGIIRVGDFDIAAAAASTRARFRLEHIGIVFQFGELLPELTVGENVGLPLRLLGRPAREARTRSLAALRSVGIDSLEGRHPGELSGGEYQRAAIARAIVTRPRLLLADEPTGALDEQNVEAVARLIMAQAREIGATVIVATHNPAVARLADRIFRLRGGQLEGTGAAVHA